MKVVRVGVVGAGFMGRSYAQLVRQHPTAELVGVADVDEAAARAAAEPLGIPWFGSGEELIASGRPEALVVATVEDAHRGPCLAALDAGIATLVEKPIATTIDDATAIVTAARRTSTLLMVAHILRFDARYALLREMVAAGQIGEPLTVYARRLNGKGAQDRLRGRCSLPIFLGVHDYDAVRWILGSEVREVVARSRVGFLADQGYPVEDASWALLTFASGTLAAVEEGWVLPNGHPAGFDQRLEINGTTGRAEVTGTQQGLAMTSDGSVVWPDTALWPTVNGRVSGDLERELNHFVACVQTGTPPLVSGEDGLAALRIALAVEEAARTGQPVRLDGEEPAP